MKVLKNYLVIAFVCLFFACTKQKSDTLDPSILQVDLDEIPRIQKSELEIMDFIPMETTSENLMGTDLRIRSSNDYYFVFDEAVQDCVHQFLRNGKYLGRRAIVGEGPNTINRLVDFFVSADGTLEVLNSNGDQAEIYRIVIDNSIEPILKVDYIPSSFTKLSSGEYLFYGSYNFPFVSHRLIRTDSTGALLERYLSNEYTNEMLPMSERNFFESISGLRIIETFNKVGYQFSENELESVISVDFGNYSIPSKFWELNLLEGGFELLQENGFANLNGLFESEDIVLISVHIQKPAGIFKDLVFYDKKSRTLQILETSLSDDYLFHYPYGVDAGQALFVTYQSEIKKEFGENLSAELSAKIPDGEYDYPVLMKVKIRTDEP